MDDRWSEENIRKTKLENLAKAREARKSKREGGNSTTSHPFTVSPAEKIPKSVDINEAELLSEPSNAYIPEFIINAPRTIFFSFCSIALSLAIPTVVGIVRDSLLQLTHPIGNEITFQRGDDKETPHTNTNPEYSIFRKV